SGSLARRPQRSASHRAFGRVVEQSLVRRERRDLAAERFGAVGVQHRRTRSGVERRKDAYGVRRGVARSYGVYLQWLTGISSPATLAPIVRTSPDPRSEL